MKCVRERLKAAQDRQKSYADKRSRPIEFQEGDRVMLKVSPWKGIIRFGKRGKLSPCFLGPFKVLARCLAEEESVIPLSEIRVDENKQCVEEPEVILESKTKVLRHREVVMVKDLDFHVNLRVLGKRENTCERESTWVKKKERKGEREAFFGWKE
ncbi:uncharacterized protein LOC112512922 [Cynara cardunculus var. scolymus]|uniref:uncharacterized protein LOC112512922 n=1 Tax=Cynara cardunculus var. scolymus TaxID=59895 RepID=UPI000D6306CA|nr:uncharacterized protein LOC112512922 [Cynara cardunculus var. scolymus]